MRVAQRYPADHVTVSRAIAAAALLLIAARSARAIDPPAMKEGLWVVTTNTKQSPGKQANATSTICRSHAYDRYVRALAKQLTGDAGTCRTLAENLQKSVYSVKTQCEVEGVTVNSESTTVYRANSTHTETHQSYSPALNGLRETTVVEDQKFLGPCPIGSKPGDLTQSNGTELNLQPQR